MNRQTLLLSTAALVAVCITGCSSGKKQQASMGMVSGSPQVLSLAAGDSLGRAVYVNDLILAAAAIERDAVYTNVEQGTIEALTEH
jgi:hypothetical protein